MKRFLIVSILICIANTASAERWFADPQKSRLEFTGEMETGPVNGNFSKYWVDMFFNPTDLGNAYIKARIQTASVYTDNAKRDAALRQQQWLYTTLFPFAEFESNSISTTDGKTFVARGIMTLRGVTGATDITFTFEQDAIYDSAQLVGTATINRLDFGIGQGQLIDQSIIGAPVKIIIDLYMRRTLE
jgi:polyisoprenoid-binding protein YceI